MWAGSLKLNPISGSVLFFHKHFYIRCYAFLLLGDFMAAVSGSIYKIEFQSRERDVLALYAGSGVYHTPPHKLSGLSARVAFIPYGVNVLSKGISCYLLEHDYMKALAKTPLPKSLSRVIPVQKSDFAEINGAKYFIGQGTFANGCEAHDNPPFTVMFDFASELHFGGPIDFSNVSAYLEWLADGEQSNGRSSVERIDDIVVEQLKRAARLDIIYWRLERRKEKHEGLLF